MLGETPLVDVHIHAARLPTLKLEWERWVLSARRDGDLRSLYDADGTLIPEQFDALLEREGVDVALVLAEYSPRVTGIQPVEDLLPLVQHNPKRIRFIGNVNPHFHYPIAREVERQLELGAVALKIHPVHGGFPPNARELYPAYAVCEDRGVPVVFHCGTSNFPGAMNRFADPVLIDDVAKDFPELTIVLAHGGRGWWYDAAAFLALIRERVWIEISGLPPQRLPQYYARHDLERLAQKFIFGTDWPGAPGIRTNAEAVATLGLADVTLERVLGGNADAVYGLDLRLQVGSERRRAAGRNT
jgi:predicted TIM-barrel fold metal-dependent hydrolase